MQLSQTPGCPEKVGTITLIGAGRLCRCKYSTENCRYADTARGKVQCITMEMYCVNALMSVLGNPEACMGVVRWPRLATAPHLLHAG
jgi:hypothetical protein